MSKIINKWWFFPLVILAIAAFVRFLWLGEIPSAVASDEITYLLNARSVILSGYDISGTWRLPLVLFFQYPPGTPQAEISYFLALLPALSEFSLFNIRLPYVLLSIGSVFLLYLIAKELMGRAVGLTAGLLAAVNPYLIYIGRTTYEMVPAMFFYLLSFYVLIKGKGRLILLSIPFLLLAFYSHIATKAILIPFVIAVVLYSYFFINKKKYLKEYLSVVVFAVALTAIFFVSLTFSSNNRAVDLLTPFAPKIAEEVDLVRKSSLASPFSGFFENKATILLRIIVTKFFNTISFDYLFINGDIFLSNWRHGLFYFLDALFIFLGMLWLMVRNRPLLLLLSSLSLISIFPHLIYYATTDNFTPHISLLIPFLLLFGGFGLVQTLSIIKRRRVWLISSLGIVAVYLFLVGNFLNIYFYQFPLQGHFDFSTRLASRYLVLASETSGVVVHTTRTGEQYRKHLLYSDSVNKGNIVDIRRSDSNRDKFIGNVIFSSCESLDLSKKDKIVLYEEECSPERKGLEGEYYKVPQLITGGSVFRIYNDKLCRAYSSKSYPDGLRISDFNVEQLSVSKFCNLFITK